MHGISQGGGDGNRPPSFVNWTTYRLNTDMNTRTHTQIHTHTHNIKFVQINLHHSKAASANLCQLIAEGKVDIALIQEPWVYKGQVRGLTNSGGKIYTFAPGMNSRSCIYIRNHINALPLLELCSRDATTVPQQEKATHHRMRCQCTPHFGMILHWKNRRSSMLPLRQQNM
jgi:hypothetical protein